MKGMTERESLIAQVLVESKAGYELDNVEREIIEAWLDGEPKWKAWAGVMRKKELRKAAKDKKLANSIRVLANKFWVSERIIAVTQALVDSGVVRDIDGRSCNIGASKSKAVKEDNPEEKEKVKKEHIKTAEATAKLEKTISEKAIDEVIEDEVDREKIKRSFDEQRAAWLESFRDIENPNSATPYGIGLWLAIEVIGQVNKKKAWIERNKLNPLEASPYSSADVSAIRTVLSALLPFAPSPTNSERKAMTMASVIIGLTAEEAKVDPDSFTAPVPAGVKKHEDIDIEPRV